MTWFRREAPRTVDDPVFGALTFNRRSGWEGKAASPTPGEKLSVSISRLDEPPNAGDRRVFTEFVARYSGLVPALSSELFKLLEPSIRISGWEGPSPHAAEELWPMVRLESLHISPGRPLELLFAFRDDVWPDAMFNVAPDLLQRASAACAGRSTLASGPIAREEVWMFGTHDLSAFVAASFLLWLTPGPDTMYILARSPNTLNPRIAIFFLAFLPQFVDSAAGLGPTPFLFLGAIFVVGGTLWSKERINDSD